MTAFWCRAGTAATITPLPDGRLLATVLRPSAKRMNSNVIAVIDPTDNRMVSVYESPAGSVHSPVYLGARPRPAIIPDQVDAKRSGRPDATGFLNCHNVRFTRNTKADWRQVRAIRVLGAMPLTTRSSHSHIVHAGHQTVELGTVPLSPERRRKLEHRDHRRVIGAPAGDGPSVEGLEPCVVGHVIELGAHGADAGGPMPGGLGAVKAVERVIEAPRTQ